MSETENARPEQVQPAQHAVNDIMPGENGPVTAGPVASEASGAHGEVGTQAGADAPAHLQIQKPSVGRIVHFELPKVAALPDFEHGETYAAIITRIHSDDIVDLHVFGHGGVTHYFSSAVHGEHWFWPPRV